MLIAERFRSAHHETLREMRLRNIHLQEESWEEASVALASHFKLYFISFASMSDRLLRDNDNKSEFHVRLDKAAQNIMKWIPLADMGSRVNAGDIRVWHLLHYTPKFAGELDIYDNDWFDSGSVVDSDEVVYNHDWLDDSEDDLPWWE